MGRLGDLPAAVGVGDESRDAGGEGLGLAIAARAVALHGGRITARNREGGGLAVTMSLPGIVREDSHAQTAAA